MSITGGISQSGTGLQRLIDMIGRGKDKKAAFARVYPAYQALQTERFQTENASEGEAWKALNPEYAKYKPRRYGGGPRRKSKKREAGQWNSYPGQGSKILVGTGMLAGAVIGPSAGSPFTDGTANHRAIFTSEQMVILVEQSGENPDGNPFNYPQFVESHRPFMSFSSASIESMKDEVRQFILGG